MEKALDKYIKEKHTQEECSGFIDGWKAAMESLKPEEINYLKFLGKKFKLHEKAEDTTIFTIESSSEGEGAMISWDEEGDDRKHKCYYSFKTISESIGEGTWILID